MSRTEIRAFGSLIIAGIALWFLQARFLDGWQVADVPPGRMLSAYVIVIIGTIVGEILVSIGASIAETMMYGAATARSSEDERDKAIAARAERIAFWFLTALVNILVVHLIFQGAYGNHMVTLPGLISASGVVFTLLVLLYAAQAVKMAATLIQYRI